MASTSFLVRLLGPALLTTAVQTAALAQTQTNQPPANYHGPDTYGMCAYVIGDTEYYGRSFYTSSYFKPQAQTEIRNYAQTQAPSQGASVRASCIWSFRESDLETMKETDRRLIGLPGHPAKYVETGWTFHGGTVGGSAGAGAVSGVSNASSPQAATSQNTVARRTTNGTSGYSGNTTAYGTAVSGSSATGATGSGATGSGAATAAGSMTGGAQQSLSDAKNNAMSTAASGMTTATNSAVGALSTGMQNMFHRRQAQPQQQPGAAGTASGGNAPAPATGTPAGSGQGAGFGFSGEGPASVPATAVAAPPVAPVEGMIADVSGKDVIINVGSQAGVRAGETLMVMHAQRTVNDPATGKPLRTIEAQVGDLRITGVEAGSASGVFSGSGVPVVGDKVRTRP